MVCRRYVARSLLCTLSGLAAAAVVVHAAPARACTPACPTSVAIPRVSAMPGNLVSFKVTEAEPATLSLATADGDPIATHIVTRAGDRIFEPVEPLGTGGGLVLTYTVCPGPWQTLAEFAFTTEQPSDVELQPSQLEVVERGVLYPERGDQSAAIVRLRYTSPDARGNAAHLLEHRATIDGQPTSITNTDGTLSIDVYTRCNPYTEDFTRGMCGDLYSVPPGTHVVEVQSHLLGASADPEPVRLAIETRCPLDEQREADAVVPPPDGSSAVGGTSPDGVETDVLPTGDGEVDPAAVDGTTSRSTARASGCALGPSDVTGGAGVFGLLLVLARRRRQPR